MKKRFIAMLLVVAQLLMLTTVATATEETTGLRFCYWDENANQAVGDLQSSWNASRGNGCPVVFYFFDGANTVSVTDGLTFSGAVKGTKREDGSCFDIQAVSFGQGSISYTSGGKTYSLPVTVSLPDFGFYRSTTVNEENYLSSFAVTDTENTFYFVASEGYKLTGVALQADFAQIAKVSRKSDTCWQITLTGTPEDHRWYGLQYSGKDQWGESFSDWSCSIELINNIPGLRFSRMWENNGQWQEDEQKNSWSELSTFCGSCDILRLYYGAGDTVAAVSDVQLTSGSDIVRLIELGDSNGLFYRLEYLKCGTAELSYKVGNRSYTQKINVTLPGVGFYSAQARDEAHYLASPVQYKDLTNGELWLICEEGFSAETDEVTDVLLGGQSIATWEKVYREGEGALYDVKITLPEMEIGAWCGLRVLLSNGEAWIDVSNQVQGNAGYVGDYAVGFAWAEEETGIIRINEGDWRTGNGYTEVSDQYSEYRTLQITAGIRKTDEQGAVYYEVNEKSGREVNLEIVSTWIEELSGTQQVFSFSPNGCEGTKTDYGTGTDVTLYSRQGYNALIRLWAEVKVTVGKNDPATVQVSVLCETNAMTQVVEHRPNNDTVEQLNNYLAGLAENLTAGCTYQIYLAPKEYEGVIQIPSNFECGPEESELLLFGTTAEDNSTTTILRGAVDLNESTTSNLNDIHFKATEGCRTAVYGGALLNMCGCSFEGYDIAVDASVGAITVTSENVFVSNGIAVRMDIASTVGGMNATAWARNTFINNSTAIQVISLNDFISSYYFRIVDSNFIGNTTDFDVQCRSTLYMYRNYYGNVHNQAKDMEQNAFLKTLSQANTATRLNQLVTSNSPNISCNHSITKVITNPRWKYPVLDWWRCRAPIELVFPLSSAQPTALNLEESYTNILVSDWNLATQIVNDEADGLIVDPSAFETEGEKQIDVVDRDENPLGTWTFDEEEN